jgi:hypothetical protein
MTNLEAWSRLSSVLEVLEHEAAALQRLNDGRLEGVLGQIASLRAEIVAALGSLHPVGGESQN